MRYIKSFESISTSTRYYKRIDLAEWGDFEPIIMSESRILKIKSMCSLDLQEIVEKKQFTRIHALKKANYNYLRFESDTTDSKSLIKCIGSWFGGKNDYIGINIFEGNDEYFYISYSNQLGVFLHYKCDQLDGLHNFLKDMGFSQKIS